MTHAPTVAAPPAYLDAIESEIAATPLLTRGDERIAAAIRRSLLSLAGAATAEHELGNGRTTDANGLTAISTARSERDLKSSRTAIWHGRSYRSTPAEIAGLLDDAAGLLLGTPWSRTEWGPMQLNRRANTPGNRTRRLVVRTILLDPEPVDADQPHRPADESLRETEVFLLTTLDPENSHWGRSELYRFNEDPDEDGNDPDRGYTRVPAGPLVSELTEIADMIVRASGRTRTKPQRDPGTRP